MLFGNNDIEVDEIEALLTYHYISIGYITLKEYIITLHLIRFKIVTPYQVYPIIIIRGGIMYKYPRLKDLREDSDLTQEFIGNLLNTTQQQYSKYENGIQEIPVHHLITLAKYYKTSLDYLVGLNKVK